MIQAKKIIGKIIKFCICYAMIFICVFLYSRISIITDEYNNTLFFVNSENYRKYEKSIPEQTEVHETTEIPEISTDSTEIKTEPETEKPYEEYIDLDLIDLKEEPIPEQTGQLKILVITEPPTTTTEYFEIPEVIPDIETEIIEPINSINTTESFEDYEYDPEQTREILISAVGDLTLASNYNKAYTNSFYEYYDLYGPGYFCENVAHIFEESDCVVANLECALTDGGTRQGNVYAYKGPAKYTDILTASNIDVVNRANNHSYDYSQSGYNDTTDALNKAGIDHYGYDSVLIKEINGIKVGFVGTVGTGSLSSVKNGLDYLAENGVEIKIVSFHWGIMDQRIANQSQVNAAHYVIDNGADLVIGHHPHVLQGIEIYKGKYIAYSIGNFIFDGNVISDIENRTSVIFQQKFILNGSKIVESSINLIPILTISNMSRNNFKPMLATGGDKDAILSKIKARSAGYHTFD